MRDLREEQIKQEDLLTKWTKISKAGLTNDQRNSETYLSAIDSIVVGLEDLHKNTIRKRSAFFKLTEGVSFEELAYIGLDYLLPLLRDTDKPLVRMGSGVGLQVRKAFSEYDLPVTVLTNLEDAKATSTVGVVLIDIIITATEPLKLFRSKMERESAKITRLMIGKGSGYEKFLKNCGYDDNSQLASDKRPMICEPTPWTDRHDGGFLTKGASKQFPLHKSTRVEDYVAPIGDTYYNALNHIQKTPFRANVKVLEVCKWMQEERPLALSKVFKEDLGKFELEMPFSRDDHPEIWDQEEVEVINKDTGKKRKAKAFVLKDDESESLRQEYFKWKQLKDEHTEHQESRKSLLRSFSSAVGVAEDMSGGDMYWPPQSDRRFRTYPAVMTGINIQGADYQKAVVEFSNSKALGSIDGVYGLIKTVCNHWANDNGFGIKTDKLNRAASEEWIKDQEEWIKACATDPKVNQQWMKADKPLQFLAAIFEYAAWLDYYEVHGDYNYECRVCDANDASCSGPQILSAITRDPVGALHTNLLSKDVQDLYMAVANKVIDNLLESLDNEIALDWLGRSNYMSAIEDVLNEKGHKILSDKSQELIVKLDKDGLTHDEIFIKLLGIGDKFEITRMSLIVRNLVKTPVMVKFYSGTKYGNGLSISEFITKNDWKGYFTGSYMKAATYMGGLIYDTINQVITGAGKVMDWFVHIAEVFGTLNTPMRWTTLAGCRARLCKYQTESVKFSVTFQGKKRALSVAINKLQEGSKTEFVLNTKGMKSAIAPDIVHSLDGSLILAVSARCAEEGLDDMWMVHDSFATHCADTVKFNRIIREEFIKLFGGDVLNDLYEDFRNQLTDDQKDLIIHPQTFGIQRGTYDINEILDSEFCFK